MGSQKVRHDWVTFMHAWVVVRQWSWTQGCLWNHHEWPPHGLCYCCSQSRSHRHAHCAGLGSPSSVEAVLCPKALRLHWLETPPQNPLKIPRSFFCSCLNWIQEWYWVAFSEQPDLMNTCLLVLQILNTQLNPVHFEREKKSWQMYMCFQVLRNTHVCDCKDRGMYYL